MSSPSGSSPSSGPSVRCPSCGLTQPRAPTCKSCGTVLAPHAAASSAPTSSAPTSAHMGPDESNRQRKRLVWGGICIILVILIAGGFYVRASPQARAERERVALQEKAERQAASGAIQALKSIQSITTAGVNYQNYAPRVLDVKVKIDQYLASRPKTPQIVQVNLDIERAMDLYIYAGKIWNAHIVRNYREESEISRQAEVLCPELVPELDRMASRFKARGEEISREEMAIPPLFLWECATRRIIQAEKHNGG